MRVLIGLLRGLFCGDQSTAKRIAQDRKWIICFSPVRPELGKEVAKYAAENLTLRLLSWEEISGVYN